MPKKNRRVFIKTGVLLAASSSLSPFAFSQKGSPAPKLNLFSKHLQFLDYKEMASTAKEIGFDGIDLTVRPRGHVLPENAERDLPQAAAAIRSAGLDLKMMTTAVDDPKDPIDRKVLQYASQEGITHYRMNWYRYPDDQSLPSALSTFQKSTQSLAKLNRKLGLVGGYQNHSGLLVGATLWEVWKILQGSDPKHMGAQYDIRHATVEGGRSWMNGLRLIRPRIQSIVLKDFRWEGKGSGTKLLNTPLGEGMVDFKKYFRLLKEYKIEVPISMHFEYDLGGAEKGKRELSISRDQVYEAMRRDIATFKRLWAEA